jgi:plasmid stability protein
MATTLTIRADDKLRAALRKRAASQGKSVSDIAREILSSALEERPLAARTRNLRGKLSLTPDVPSDSWQSELRERNWRA